MNVNSVRFINPVYVCVYTMIELINQFFVFDDFRKKLMHSFELNVLYNDSLQIIINTIVKVVQILGSKIIDNCSSRKKFSSVGRV